MIPEDGNNLIDQNQDRKKRSPVLVFFMETFQTILLAIILYVLIDIVVARVRVENISMVPTLMPGEFVLVNKLGYRYGEIDRGEIIIFHNPANPDEDFVKRVIGLPGDVVQIKDGHVIVNGNQLTENYIRTIPEYNGEWNIPVESVFVLGDNRNESSDSHIWGFVPKQNIIGKAVFVYWPPGQIRSLMKNNLVMAATP
jgi:signal peptidase I